MQVQASQWAKDIVVYESQEKDWKRKVTDMPFQSEVLCLLHSLCWPTPSLWFCGIPLTAWQLQACQQKCLAILWRMPKQRWYQNKHI